MEKITSKTNSLIKETKKLFTSSKERAEKEMFVLEGARLCFDAVNSDCEIKTVLITESCFEKNERFAKVLINKAESSYIITEEISSKISQTQTSQGIFALCKMKSNQSDIDYEKKYIALDCVRDPSNLGAVSRSAEALGISGIIVYNCCDIYNPKALRASMGSLLRIPVVKSENLCETIEKLKKNSMKVYATVPDSYAKDIRSIDFSGGSVCVIGNEANGISSEVKASCDLSITIKMLGLAESLNAGVAASITMWEMLRGEKSE